MIRMDNKIMKTAAYDKVAQQDILCRTITFRVFSIYGTSASKNRENIE